jgi:hypothetical protein
MSPNFALILSVPAWNDPAVKKDNTNGAYAKAKKGNSMPNGTAHDLAINDLPIPPYFFAIHLFAILRFVSESVCASSGLVQPLAIQSTLTLPVTYGNSQ